MYTGSQQTQKSISLPILAEPVGYRGSPVEKNAGLKNMISVAGTQCDGGLTGGLIGGLTGGLIGGLTRGLTGRLQEN